MARRLSPTRSALSEAELSKVESRVMKYLATHESIANRDVRKLAHITSVHRERGGAPIAVACSESCRISSTPLARRRLAGQDRFPVFVLVGYIHLGQQPHGFLTGRPNRPRRLTARRKRDFPLTARRPDTQRYLRRGSCNGDRGHRACPLVGHLENVQEVRARRARRSDFQPPGTDRPNLRSAWKRRRTALEDLGDSQD